jgi:hypothetical protein
MVGVKLNKNNSEILLQLVLSSPEHTLLTEIIFCNGMLTVVIALFLYELFPPKPHNEF